MIKRAKLTICRGSKNMCSFQFVIAVLPHATPSLAAVYFFSPQVSTVIRGLMVSLHRGINKKLRVSF